MFGRTLLKPLRGNTECAAQYRALSQELLILALWRAVGDDAAAGLVAVHVVAKYQGANGDCLIHVAAPAKIPDRPAVELPADRLELVDDFHRAYFRRTHQRAGGKSGGEKIE